MELGSGTGLLGIALSRVGTDSILLTDGDPSAFDNCRHNLGGNGIMMAPEETIDRANSCCQVIADPYVLLAELTPGTCHSNSHHCSFVERFVHMKFGTESCTQSVKLRPYSKRFSP